MRPSVDQQQAWMKTSSLFHVSTYTVTYPECMSCVGPWKLINSKSSFSEWLLLCPASHCTWHSAMSISFLMLRELKRTLRECSNWINYFFLLTHKSSQEEKKNTFSITKSTNLRVCLFFKQMWGCFHVGTLTYQHANLLSFWWFITSPTFKNRPI